MRLHRIDPSTAKTTSARRRRVVVLLDVRGDEEEDEINLADLLGYLRQLIGADRKVINGNSELKRLIRIYDFLKYKKAFDKSANSGNPT